MQQIVLWIHVLACVAIIFLVLLQHGKGADAGVTFGSGSSNTMFGSQGALPFLLKLTVLCAVVFFSTSMILSYQAAHPDHQRDHRLPVAHQSGNNHK